MKINKEIKKINKFFTTYYFKKFVQINLGVGLVLFVSRFLFRQEVYILIIYVTVCTAFAVYAQINFELGRAYAGIGSALMILFLLRLAVVPAIRNQIGVFANIDSTQQLFYLNSITSNAMIETFSIIGLFSVFFFILDMYLGVKKMQNEY